MKSIHLNKVLVIASLIILAGCKPDDDNMPPPCDDPANSECPNYDPCFGKEPVTADFKIFDDIFQSGSFVGTYYQDSVLYNGNIKFEAVEDSAYYKWYLGQEIVEGVEDSVVIKGINNLSSGTYTAALVVDKEPDTLCFPMDTGRDSTFRTFTIVDKCDLLVLNKFRGVFETAPATAPSDSVTIEFLYVDVATKEPDCESFYLGGVNLRGLGDTSLTGDSMGMLNSYIEWKRYEYIQPLGSFEVFADSSCRAEYLIWDDNYVFNGKIQL
jgi:hypothetical protein